MFLSPLHLAVIEDSALKVKDLLEHGANPQVPDSLGFTPLELAQLLGKNACQRVLGYAGPVDIKLQRKTQKKISRCSIGEIETIFGITYRSFLSFSSYEDLQKTIFNCPYILRYSWIAKENHAWKTLYQRQLGEGLLADVAVIWIDDVMGYGLFAEEDLAEGSFIGEYTGRVRRLYRRQADQNAYCLQYPTRWWSWKYMAVDALHEGNLTRFMNHSDTPNVEPLCVVDRGLLHQIFVAKHPIKKGAQLTFNYGADFWAHRQKIAL